MHAIDSVAFGVMVSAVLLGTGALMTARSPQPDMDTRATSAAVSIACAGVVASSAWWLWAS